MTEYEVWKYVYILRTKLKADGFNPRVMHALKRLKYYARLKGIPWPRSRSQRSKTWTCECRAYPYPHRPGGGQCQREMPHVPYCKECGSHEFGVEDQGIGPHEFWGAPANDVQLVLYCKECDSDEIVRPSGGEYTAQDLIADERALRAEAMYDDAKERGLL